MEAVKFTISGNFAFFKKPEYNKVYEGKHNFITFNQLPKTHLLGFFGAMLGFNSFDKENNYYSFLKDIKLSIIPEKAHFLKEKHGYLDHTGKLFLTKKSNILIIEELLYKPSWDVVLAEGNKFYKDIKESLLNNKSKCHLYLGKNEFFANIKNVETVNLEEDKASEFERIDSMFMSEELKKEDLREAKRIPFLYKEYLPFKFNKDDKYEYDLFYFTNQPVNLKKIKGNLYKMEEKRICLF